MKKAAVIAALGTSSGGGRRWVQKVFVVLCVVHVSVSFAVSSGEDESGDEVTAVPPVLVGNFSNSHRNDTQHVRGDTGKNKSCECGGDEVKSEEEKHAEKIEQLLWDIFVEEGKGSDDEEASDVAPEQEDRYREGDDDAIDREQGKDEVEEVKEDESVPPHSISKRSAEEEELVDGEERSGRRATLNDKRRNKGSNKKGSHNGKKAGSSNRGHSRPKSKAKKTTNVGKYNEYMDVVLKRMNTMIKSKKMDPLMVNLFSGNQQQQTNQANNKNKNKENSKNKGGKNKKKKNQKDNGKKKRKGAKSNRARMEELDEMEARSVSSDSDSSATVELDNEHDGNIHTGVGGVFIRRVGEYEHSDGDEDEEEHDGEEEDDLDEDSDDERSFREIRALIVNGSMKRSLNETETVTASSPSPTVETETESDEKTRGFSDSPPTSSEESPRKKSSSSKGKKKTDKNKSSKKEEKSNGNKKPAAAKKTRATRGVLKGLSSLKRSGNVDVIRQSDNVRIVRGKFTLGPVTLEIVPKVVKKSVQGEPKDEERSKKGKPKQDADDAEPPKVTAIARELKGVIEVRLKKNSPTTIKRLRVFPPSAVNVKSSSKSKTTGKSSSSVPRYNRVTPVATHRLRQIASAVVRQTDVRRKGSSLEKTRQLNA